MKAETNELEIFINRMKKIGIKLELSGNAPWIYLDAVNGNRVSREDYNANHGYTVAWYPSTNRDTFRLHSDLGKTFEIIRKYR